MKSAKEGGCGGKVNFVDVPFDGRFDLVVVVSEFASLARCNTTCCTSAKIIYI